MTLPAAQELFLERELISKWVVPSDPLCSLMVLHELNCVEIIHLPRAARGRGRLKMLNCFLKQVSLEIPSKGNSDITYFFQC